MNAKSWLCIRVLLLMFVPPAGAWWLLSPSTFWQRFIVICAALPWVLLVLYAWHEADKELREKAEKENARNT